MKGILSTLWAGVLAFGIAATATAQTGQSSRGFPLRATNYKVEATIHPEDQTLSARAEVEFVANEVSRNAVVELHPDLHVNSVRSGSGQSLSFERDRNNPLLLYVFLPEAATPGKTFKVVFDYAGPVSSENDSPTKGLRFAAIDKNSTYLLLPARWFPLTNFPSNRYTGTFEIIVPDTFAVVGTGKAESPNIVPSAGKGGGGRASYVFHCDRPGPVGTFVAGSLQLSPVKTEGFEIPVYAPPSAASSTESYASTLVHILTYYSDSFGVLKEPSVTIAQMPDGSVPGFSAPGLLLISARQWTPKPNERLLAQLAAGQWWGDAVMPASPSDTWLSDGLARYSEALYAEESEGTAGLHKALEELAIGALMYEDAAPIAQGERLQAYSEAYRSVVADKGAMVFHMLRAELGNDAFASLLKEFFSKYAGRTATLAEFEKMAEAKAPRPAAGQPPLNLTAFFSQWLTSTGVPEFKMEFIVYRTKKGFKVVGKIQQDLETLRMPIEVRVDTEGNPVTKKILVSGTSSPFEIDTFGRPKPNGVIIDPNNNLLKSSPKLRVRAAIARGEGLAQDGKFYEAIQEYQKALEVQSNNSLAHFRMGEAMFYQKNYQAAANAFRAALDGDLDINYKWVEVWGHIYLGKIFDVIGQRDRAINEYSKAQQLGDDTGGAQAEASKYLQKPYTAS